jgi:hypothetical protein
MVGRLHSQAAWRDNESALSLQRFPNRGHRHDEDCPTSAVAVHDERIVLISRCVCRADSADFAISHLPVVSVYAIISVFASFTAGIDGIDNLDARDRGSG